MANQTDEIRTDNQTPEDCTHDCRTCGSDCPSRDGGGIQKAELNEHSSIKKVIGVVSGKGGVGKSMVTALSALAASRHGYKTGIMDADLFLRCSECIEGQEPVNSESSLRRHRWRLNSCPSISLLKTKQIL